jgi:predicted nucleic acid-binding protein
LVFELDATLRRLGAQRRAKPLARRAEDELPFVEAASASGPPLLLDSTVYIDILRGRAPLTVETLVERRFCHHSSVCLAELTHAFERLDPAHPGTAGSLAAIRKAIASIRPHRLSAPDTETWGAAGALAGLLFRLGGYGRGQERALLNDALVYLQARNLGCRLLTANAADFDLLHQLVPDGRILLYKTA